MTKPYPIFSTFLICILAFFLSPKSINGEEECVKGDIKMMDCNTCFCAGSDERGYGGWACTEMACRGPYSRIGKREIEASGAAEERIYVECSRGRSYFDGCNWCYCDGSPYGDICTLKACPPY